jgi:hypothetical protein
MGGQCGKLSQPCRPVCVILAAKLFLIRLAFDTPRSKEGCGRNVTLFFLLAKRTKREQNKNEHNGNKQGTKGEQTVNK